MLLAAVLLSRTIVVNRKAQYRVSLQRRPQPPSSMETTTNSLSTRDNPSLLSLPDDILRKMFRDLGACDTTLNLRTPRHAFALAQANKHLLQIFCGLFTFIGPDIDYGKHSSLSSRHLLAVARLIGPKLQAIHIPRPCLDILSQLSRVCPNLKRIRIVQEQGDVLEGLLDILKLPLQKLTIYGVSRLTLDLIRCPPRELTMTLLNEKCFEDLKRILKFPLNKLFLVFSFERMYESLPEIVEMIGCITEACPKLESLTVKIYPDFFTGYNNFEADARKLISEVRTNSKNSLCRTVYLQGLKSFPILSKVHPAACVSLKRHGVEFTDEGDGLFAFSLRLEDSFLNTDISRVHKVIVMLQFNPKWNERFSGLRLDYARVQGIGLATEMRLNVDMVRIARYIYTPELDYVTKWDWLRTVREVVFPLPPQPCPITLMSGYLETLSGMLDNFYGNAVWIDSATLEKRDDIVNPSLIAPGEKVLFSIEKFEERGGDAVSVRNLVMGYLGSWLSLLKKW